MPTEADIKNAQNEVTAYELVILKLPHSPDANAQNPLPVSDAISGNAYEIFRNKEYMVPRYMVSNLEQSYTPIYQMDPAQNLDHKSMVEATIPMTVREVPHGINAREYAKKQGIEILFTVPHGKIEAALATANAGAKKSKD